MIEKETKEELVKKIHSITNLSRSTIYRFFSEQHVKRSSEARIVEALSILENQDSEHKNSNKQIVVSASPKTFDIFEGYSDVFSGILNEASKHGVSVIFDKSYKAEKKDNLGVIIIGKDNEELDEECKTLSTLGIPFVLVNRITDNNDYSYVSVDVKKAAFDITCHMLEQGYRKIAFCGKLDTLVAQQKFEGYKEALKSRGIAIDEKIIETDTDANSLDETFNKFISQPDKPDSFFAMDDNTALRIARLAFEHNLTIPYDLGVSGMNDLDTVRNSTPSLSSVKIDFREIGRESVNSLLKLLDSTSLRAIKLIMNHKLMIRDSTMKNERIK